MEEQFLRAWMNYIGQADSPIHKISDVEKNTAFLIFRDGYKLGYSQINEF